MDQKKEFILACKNGWRISKAINTYTQTGLHTFKLDSKSFAKKVICGLIQQHLLYNYLFWGMKHNTNIAFNIDNNNNWTFKDLTKVKFSEWKIPRVPSIQQIILGAACKVNKNKVNVRCVSMYINVFLLSLIWFT